MAGQDKQPRRAGRPMKPIDPELPQTVISWLQVWREVVLEPLRAADPPWTLEKMAAELRRRAGDGRAGNAARADVSGTAKPTLQRFFAGERVPTRDLVQHLLDIAHETLDPPPTPQQTSDLWTAYRAALRTTFTLLADLYDALDTRDAARRRAEDLQREKNQLAADLALSQRQEQRLKVLLSHTAAELEHNKRLADIRHDDARRARAEADRLSRRLHELEAEQQRTLEDAERLKHDLARLREQQHTSALAARIGELEAAHTTLREEHEELGLLLHTVVDALRDVTQRAATLERQQQERLADLDNQRSLPAQEGDLEHRHEIAVRAVEHLSGQLRSVSRELADARAELLRRDGDLARLVEEHAEEITTLRADHVLAEADSILSLALHNLDPAPATLPPVSDVPTPETTDLPSPEPPTPPLRPGTAPSGTSPELTARTSPSPQPRSEPALAGSEPVQPLRPIPRTRRPRPGSTAPAPPTAVPGRRAAHGDLSRRRGLLVSASAASAVAGLGIGLVWVLHPFDDTTTPHDSAAASKTPSATSSATPLPGQPAEDPVADIGGQEVNTAAVMKLRSCAAGDVKPVVRSMRNTYAGTEKARFELKITAADSGDNHVPCRIDVDRTRIAVVITRAGDDGPTWDSSHCLDGHGGQRWIKVTRGTPATVEFTWNRIPDISSCNPTSQAAASTYLVETSGIGPKAQTSFVLEAPQPTQNRATSSPSSPASGSADTSSSGGSTGGGFIGSGGTDQSGDDPSATESASSTPTDVDGGTANGNGGLFGGPAG
ncbi:hypothetical protein [Streptomyces sp. NPDC059378]|uniref:hypothetical protein n=1 Tax=Streptomyces sp. NPDC059378 TaxID=3346815 RepID=UPI0036BCD46D